MAYEPTVWETGDVITAEKLNKAEQGIADAGAYIVPVILDEQDNITGIGASYNDLVSNVSRGIFALMLYTEFEQTSYYPLISFGHDEGEYWARFAVFSVSSGTYEAIRFISATADGNMTVEE